MFTRIAAIAEAEGHHPDLHLESYNTVYAERSTHAVGRWQPSLVHACQAVSGVAKLAGRPSWQVAPAQRPCLGSEGDQGVFTLCAAGGLTENDFIMAAKINQLDFSDLHAPKKKRTFFY